MQRFDLSLKLWIVRGVTVVTSMVTLLEVLVHPFRHGEADLAQQYRDILLNTEHLNTIDISQDTAEEAAASVHSTTSGPLMLFSSPLRFMPMPQCS